MAKKKSTRRRSRLVLGVAAMLASVVACATNAAESSPSVFPSKPIRWIDPFPAGGASDILARMVAQKMTETWKQAVIVDNRGGASGMIGVDIIAKAAPDGYTIGDITATLSVNPSVNKHPPYNLLKDLAPVIQLSRQPYMLVAYPGVAANNVQQLIALAKSRPGQINYGSSGVGGLSHLTGALLSVLAGVDMVNVPYKGGAPALAGVLSGEIQLLFATVLSSQPHVKAGRLKWLAVSSEKRFRLLPDIPSVAESIPGFDVTGWYGVVAPDRTPNHIITQLNKEIARILEMAEIKERMINGGIEPVGSTPEAFWTHVGHEVEKWRKVVKAIGLKSE